MRQLAASAMVAASLLALASLLILAASGGSSRRFHSATHYYSVHQVEAAFAEHGIALRRAARQYFPGFVHLGNGKVLVTVRVAKGARRLARLPLGWPSRADKHGNLLVVYKEPQTMSVYAALADLH
jgi:hypothetical protein